MKKKISALLSFFVFSGCATSAQFAPVNAAGNSCANQCDQVFESCASRGGASCDLNHKSCYKDCAHYNGGSYTSAVSWWPIETPKVTEFPAPKGEFSPAAPEPNQSPATAQSEVKPK